MAQQLITGNEIIANVSLSGTLTTSANLTFSGTGARILGDFSNATLASRVAFQSSTTNGNTGVFALPNGASQTSAFRAFSTADPTNSSFADVAVVGTYDARFSSGISGTGTYLPMTFFTGGSERMRIATDGSVGIGTSSPSTIFHAKTSSAQTVGVFESTSTVASFLSVRDANTGAGTQVAVGAVGNNLILRAGNNEQVRIDSSGNVGIGITSMTGKLDIKTASAAAAFTVPTQTSIGANSSTRVNLISGEPGLMLNSDISPTNGTQTGTATYSMAMQIGYYNTNDIRNQIFWSGSSAPLTFTYASSPTGSATERMRIDSSGNVSIGTTSVASGYRMEVDTGASSAASNPIVFSARNTAGQLKRLYVQASALDTSPVYTLTTGAVGTDPAIAFAPAGTERMRIDTSGNLLIGLSGTAISKLTVNGAIYSGSVVTSAAGFYQSGTNTIIENTDDTGTAGNSQIRFRVRTYGTPINAMSIDAAGNVGIGTTSPGYKLDVNGTGNFSGALTFTSGVLLSSVSGAGNMNMQCTNASTPVNGYIGANAFYNNYWALGSSNAYPLGFVVNGSLQGVIDTSYNFKFNSGYGSAATAYGCRVWVNWNGTGTTGANQTIRGSGNVTSVYKSATGVYQVNFTNAMPDVNYATSYLLAETYSASNSDRIGTVNAQTTYLVVNGVLGGGASYDMLNCNVMVFR